MEAKNATLANHQKTGRMLTLRNRKADFLASQQIGYMDYRAKRLNNHTQLEDARRRRKKKWNMTSIVISEAKNNKHKETYNNLE